MESKVGRMGSGFYTLMSSTNFRLAYLWQRQLFTDLPNTPPRQRLEFYEFWNVPIWIEMFSELDRVTDRVARFEEYVADGDITLQRIFKSPTGRMGCAIYDGEQIIIDASSSESVTIRSDEVGASLCFPKSLVWSNLIVKERIYGEPVRPQ